ncbi:MAG: 3-phosphoserine/phosphohydroxythreonine transaminase [Fibrobacterales bacterium]
MSVFNFSAGPAILDKGVMKRSAEAAIEFAGTGLSILEMSHRSAPIVAMFDETKALIAEQLGVPDNYEILFLQGGASLQFAMIPMNFAKKEGVVDIVNTGTWTQKAIKELKLFSTVNIAGTSEESNFTTIPTTIDQSDNAEYLHVCTNNTIFGTRYITLPEVKNPNGFLVADLSSEIFARHFDVSKFGIIFAGAQKNMGPAGVALVVIRKDLLDRVNDGIPTMMDYRTHVKADSMFNTPPVFSVKVINETMKWLKELGGVSAMEKINDRKAAKLYTEIDRNPLFKGVVDTKYRSTMNVTFVSVNPDHETLFLTFVEKKNLSGLPGHRSVGGFRASIYNAMPEAGIDALIAAMQEFEAIHS